MRILTPLLVCVHSFVFAQPADWINKPQDEWPQIALVNEVWYSTGERYIHPSFEYAATGFLIDTGEDTLAVTAKHVLWVAKTSTMNAVDFQGKLDKWIMRPKGNPEDSVVIKALINADSSELLSGPGSSITQRDWIVFHTSYISQNIQPLKVRYTEVQAGEMVYYTGCPYNDDKCITNESKMIEVEGNRIVFSKPEGANIAGASGSPIIDKNGFLVGILGGAATAKTTGENALYGTTTHYLKKVVENDKPLNIPLISLGEKLKEEYDEYGLKHAIDIFADLKEDKNSYFIYDFSPEEINRFAQLLVDRNKLNDAIQFFELSLEELPLSNTYASLGRVYLILDRRMEAKSSLEKALELWPENEEALKLMQKL